ncbi:MAG TPA: tetratricopeptide repeat protein [Chondromyces sp.]|nr:tetratricopeptide repeat protein [Chondromyces sp.]
MTVLRLKPLGSGAAARLRRARFLYETGRRDEAIAEAESILVGDPGSYPTRFFLAQMMASRGDTWRAMLEFGLVLRAHPRHVESLRSLGDLHFSLDAFEAAAGFYRRVLEIDRRDVSAWLKLGAVAFASGRHEDAVLAYQRAVQLDRRLTASGHTIGDFHSLMRTLQHARNGV